MGVLSTGINKIAQCKENMLKYIDSKNKKILSSRLKSPLGSVLSLNEIYMSNLRCFTSPAYLSLISA